MASNLAGKVVVITGASSGFGRGAALKFAAGGASLVLAARRDDVLHEVVEQCITAGGRATAVSTDVGERDQVEQLSRSALAGFGRIDVWVNNAGAGAIGRFGDVPLEDHVRVIQTDLIGTLYGSYYALQYFRRQGSGVLINVASVIGKVPAPYFASYAAAKHGVVGLSAALRQELEQDGIKNIRVCTLMPTTFDTPFFEHAAQYTGREASPIPPTYDPKDVVDIIVKLATKPQDEVSVGTAAKVATFAHHFFPGMVESMMARETRKAELEKAEPGENTSGSLHQPMAAGKSVDSGWKE
jgi:short-subunit dehydrogenase